METLNEIWRKDPLNWKWYVIYYNKLDTRLWVSKRYGWGWTINFAKFISFKNTSGSSSKNECHFLIPKQEITGTQNINPLTNLPKQGFSGPDASWFKNQSLKFKVLSNTAGDKSAEAPAF